MKKPAAVVTVAILFVLGLSPLGATQDGDARKRPEGPAPEGKRKDVPPEGVERKGPPPPLKEGERKGPPPPPKESAKPDAKCGKELAPCLDEIKKRKGVNRELLEGITRDHFKVFHPDGCCHCECGHKVPPPEAEGEKRSDRKCGRDPVGLGEDLRKRKDLGNDDVDRHVKDHFRIRHPDGVCHCFCRHEEGSKGDGPRGDAPKDGAGKDGRKGNNGVGNGVDPQPPGNPPVNDGPGTCPGNPGNKKGGGEGRK